MQKFSISITTRLRFFLYLLQPETVKVDSDSINIGLKQKRKVKGYL